jgi:ABC-2 type transport system permease protein/lipopolysaccharide transport system permease protein
VLFSYLGLIPWGFFAGAIVAGSNSLLINLTLINKVACPREVFPIAAVVTALIDSFVTALALPVLFLASGFVPKLAALWLPVVLLVQVTFTLGLSLLLASVLMFVRDVRHGLPLLVQLGLFATPVAYGFNSVPKNLRPLYSLANPIGPVIDGYRRTVLFGHAPRWSHLGLAACTAVVTLLVGYGVFKRLEPGFADVG